MGQDKGIPSADLSLMLDGLRNFPSNAKPEDSEATFLLIAYGLIERQEVKKPCRTCGTSLLDYSYFRITAAGRCVLALTHDAQPSEGITP